MNRPLLPWKLLGLVGTGLAVPWACSSSECDGPGGLCVEVPKGAANTGGRGGIHGGGGEHDGGMAGDIAASARGGSSGKGGAKGKGGAGGKAARGGRSAGGARPMDLGGMGGADTAGAPQAGEPGSGGSGAVTSNGGSGGSGGRGGRGGRGGASGKDGAGAMGGSAASGGTGTGGAATCGLGEIPVSCGASSGGAAGDGGGAGAGAGEGGSDSQGWCAVPDAGAGGQDSTGGIGGSASPTGGTGGGTAGKATGGTSGKGAGGAGGRGSLGGSSGGPGKPKTALASTRRWFPIDDLEDGDRLVPPVLGARGYWYVAAEGSGAMFPTPGCAPVTSPATGFADHASNAAMHMYGSGTFIYAQVGISLWTGAPACDQPLYALGMTGVRFWAKGTSALQNVRFMIATPETMPPEYGGTCTSNCFLYPHTTELLNDEWREYVVPFSELGIFTPTILNLIWEAQDEGGRTSTCFDLWIDDVAFYQDE